MVGSINSFPDDFEIGFALQDAERNPKAAISLFYPIVMFIECNGDFSEHTFIHRIRAIQVSRQDKKSLQLPLNWR